jgi:hypothetical protein
VKERFSFFLIALMSSAAPGWVANVTQVVMNLDIANGITPPAGPSRVRVPPGESVTLVLPAEWPGPTQGRKDGEAILGATGSKRVLGPVTSDGSGPYTAAGGWPD